MGVQVGPAGVTRGTKSSAAPERSLGRRAGPRSRATHTSGTPRARDGAVRPPNVPAPRDGQSRGAPCPSRTPSTKRGELHVVHRAPSGTGTQAKRWRLWGLGFSRRLGRRLRLRWAGLPVAKHGCGNGGHDRGCRRPAGSPRQVDANSEEEAPHDEPAATPPPTPQVAVAATCAGDSARAAIRGLPRLGEHEAAFEGGSLTLRCARGRRGERDA